jgi:L-lactate dehydrogenase complex protein LldF
VCPVRIPLPKLMRHWREEQFRRQLTPATARRGLALWAFFASRPWLYRLATGMAMRALGSLGRKGRFRALPLAGGWTDTRDFPAPQGRTFMSQWRRGRRPR